MKNILLLVVSIFLLHPAFAQVEITAETFPESGDTLYTMTDGMPSGITLELSGNSPTWDYSTLQAPFVTETIYRPTTEGIHAGEFPSGTLFTDFAGGEGYFRGDASKLEFLGYFGADPTNLGLEVVVRFTPPTVERIVPLNYPDVYNNSTSFNVALAWDDLPAILTDSLDMIFTPDSLRVLVDIDRQNTIDAHGDIKIPGGTFDVIRQKRLEIRSTSVEASLPFLGWTDITDLVPVDLFGADTTLTYSYLSPESKEAIAIVTVDSNTENITFVNYKSIGETITIVPNANSPKPEVYVYPNPVISELRFRFANMEGKYKIKLFNLLGVEVMDESYMIAGSKTTVKLNVSKLRKGTYLYSVIDERGKTLMTRRVMVERP